MKRIGVSALLAVTLLASALPSANAVVTPGSKCSKAGVKQTYKGKIYTCIRLGSKLYWNNGLKIESGIGQNLGKATCDLRNSQWFTLQDDINLRDGLFGHTLFSTSITNSSKTAIATNIKIYVEYSDQIGIYYRSIINIPRLYPNQILNLGDNQVYGNKDGWPKLPDAINARAVCESRIATKEDMFNGKYPIIKGVGNGKIFQESPEIFEYKLQAIVTNSTNKDFDFNEYDDTQIYGVFKDKFGNVLGGFNRILNNEGNREGLLPGESANLIQFIMSGKKGLIEFSKRATIVEYTIIQR